MKPEWLLAAGLLLMHTAPVRAAEPPDPALLEYLAVFADEQGNLFDPADLEAATRTPSSSAPPKPEAKSHE